MSNLRQFGTGYMMYADQNQGFLPWTGDGDGYSTSKPFGPWDDTAFWANSVPPLVGATSYYQLILNTNGGIPRVGANNIFVCPSASPAATADTTGTETTDGQGAFMMYGTPPGSAPLYVTGVTAPGATGKPVYWCYVVNSKIDNSVIAGQYFIKISKIKYASDTAFMTEKAMSPAESIPGCANSLARAKTTWTRFPNRHNGGGHVLFADGHVSWLLQKAIVPPNGFATGKVTSADDPNNTNPAWNVPNQIIWDPAQAVLFGTGCNFPQ
jgi:prepilin-type processing-associated H-X9-DG protein